MAVQYLKAPEDEEGDGRSEEFDSADCGQTGNPRHFVLFKLFHVVSSFQLRQSSATKHNNSNETNE